MINYYGIRFLVIVNPMLQVFLLYKLLKYDKREYKNKKGVRLEIFTLWLTIFTASIIIIRLTYSINMPLFHGVGLIWATLQIISIAVLSYLAIRLIKEERIKKS